MPDMCWGGSRPRGKALRGLRGSGLAVLFLRARARKLSRLPRLGLDLSYHVGGLSSTERLAFDTYLLAKDTRASNMTLPTRPPVHHRYSPHRLPLRSLALLLGIATLGVLSNCASQPPPPVQSVVAPPSAGTSPAPPASSDSPPVPATASAAAPIASASAPPPAGQPPVPGFVAIAVTHKGKFPGVRPPKGRMFALKAATDASSDACPEVVGQQGHPCARLVQPGVNLNAVNIERVTDLLSDGRAFRAAEAKCYEPSHAFVFYDDKDVPIGWAEVSLGCGALRALPTLTGIAANGDKYTLSAAALAYLRGLSKTLKLEAPVRATSLDDRR